MKKKYYLEVLNFSILNPIVGTMSWVWAFEGKKAEIYNQIRKCKYWNIFETWIYYRSIFAPNCAILKISSEYYALLVASNFSSDKWTASINCTYFENYSALKIVKSPLNVHHLISHFVISYALILFQEGIKRNIISCCTIVLILNVQHHL